MANMTNELLVKAVAKKAKIPDIAAQIAVDTVLNLLKNKLPPAVGTVLDSLLNSESATTSKAKKSKSKKDDSLLGDIGSFAGKLLGGK